MNKSALQALKFTLFSISAAIVQLLSFALLHDVLVWEVPFEFPQWMGVLFNATGEADWQFYLACYLPSLILSVVWNFTVNRKYTFKPTGHVARDMALVLGYYIVFICATGALSIALKGIGAHDWVIQIVNMLLNFVTEFLFQKFVVYRD